MLYHSLGIKMQVNISSSFLLKLHEKSEIINLIRELCIPVLALKCHWRFLPDFFCWSFMKNQEQIKKRRPHCDTQLKTLKISYSFFYWRFMKSLLPVFCWSFIKSQEINQFERSTLYHSRFPLVFFTEPSWKVKRQKRHEDAKRIMIKIFDLTGISENCWHEDTKNMVSKLFIALIVIRIRPFILWQEFLKIADMKTQKIWFQNFLLLSLW